MIIKADAANAISIYIKTTDSAVIAERQKVKVFSCRTKTSRPVSMVRLWIHFIHVQIAVFPGLSVHLVLTVPLFVLSAAARLVLITLISQCDRHLYIVQLTTFLLLLTTVCYF